MFIVIEGIDGSGKTTQLAQLQKWFLEELGEMHVVATKEPGGWDGSDCVRECLLNHDFHSSWSEFFLFMMDRCEHVARVVAPSLSQGKTVLSDRYIPSTLAYQLYGNTSVSKCDALFISSELIPRLGFPLADVIFWLDVDVDVARERLLHRGSRNAFDEKGADYYQRVRDGYADIMGRGEFAEHWVRIEADQSERDVFDRIRETVFRILAVKTKKEEG